MPPRDSQEVGRTIADIAQRLGDLERRAGKLEIPVDSITQALLQSIVNQYNQTKRVYIGNPSKATCIQCFSTNGLAVKVTFNDTGGLVSTLGYCDT